MAKAHKNADFVLGDGCREPNSAHWSSAALPRALRGASGSRTPGNRLPQPTTQPAVVHAPGQPTRWHTTVSKQPGYLLPLIPPLRYRQELLPGNLLPGILPCIPPTNLPPCATAEELPPCNLTAGAYYRAMGPAPSGRVIRM